MSYLNDVFRQTADEGYFDFARCQRPDGTIYGSPSGKCKKGTLIGDKEETGGKRQRSNRGMRLTEKVKSMSAADLKKVAQDPRLTDRQKSKLEKLIKAKESSDKAAESKTPSAAADKGRDAKVKEPKGLFMKGDKVDIFEVEKKAEAWRKEAGLNATPGTIDWKHDRVHALTHEFLGGSDKIGKWLGNDGKSPTPAEETLVNMVHRTAAIKARGDNPKLTDMNLDTYFRRDIQFMTGRGNIPDSDMKLYYNEKGEPDTKKFIEKYREMEASPGYQQLLDASHSAWSNAGDYVL